MFRDEHCIYEVIRAEFVAKKMEVSFFSIFFQKVWNFQKRNKKRIRFWLVLVTWCVGVGLPCRNYNGRNSSRSPHYWCTTVYEEYSIRGYSSWDIVTIRVRLTDVRKIQGEGDFPNICIGLGYFCIFRTSQALFCSENACACGFSEQTAKSVW